MQNIQDKPTLIIPKQPSKPWDVKRWLNFQRVNKNPLIFERKSKL